LFAASESIAPEPAVISVASTQDPSIVEQLLPGDLPDQLTSLIQVIKLPFNQKPAGRPSGLVRQS
jgi:hypothetical protein